MLIYVQYKDIFSMAQHASYIFDLQQRKRIQKPITKTKTSASITNYQSQLSNATKFLVKNVVIQEI